MSNKRERSDSEDVPELLDYQDNRRKNLKKRLNDCVSLTKHITKLQGQILSDYHLVDNESNRFFNRNIEESRKEIVGLLEDIHHKYMIQDLTYILLDDE